MRDVAKEQGVPYEPDRHDNIHRLNMGTFPEGAEIIANPYNKIPGFSCFVERANSLTQHGPRNGLRPAAGAAAPPGGSWLLGSDTNFASVQSTDPAGQAEGLANLGSDPKNQRGGIISHGCIY